MTDIHHQVKWTVRYEFTPIRTRHVQFGLLRSSWSKHSSLLKSSVSHHCSSTCCGLRTTAWSASRPCSNHPQGVQDRQHTFGSRNGRNTAAEGHATRWSCQSIAKIRNHEKIHQKLKIKNLKDLKINANFVMSLLCNTLVKLVSL